MSSLLLCFRKADGSRFDTADWSDRVVGLTELPIKDLGDGDCREGACSAAGIAA